jgi:hypothetical protein
MYSPKRHSLFRPILKARRMSALFHVRSSVRSRGRRVSFVYLTSALICVRRQAFLPFVWTVSCLACGNGVGVSGVTHASLCSLVHRRRSILSFICLVPGESWPTHIILYNMLSPFASRNYIDKIPEAAIFLILFKFFLQKIVKNLFCSPFRAEHFPGPIVQLSCS